MVGHDELERILREQGFKDVMHMQEPRNYRQGWLFRAQAPQKVFGDNMDVLAINIPGEDDPITFTAWTLRRREGEGHKLNSKETWIRTQTAAERTNPVQQHGTTTKRAKTEGNKESDKAMDVDNQGDTKMGQRTTMTADIEEKTEDGDSETADNDIGTTKATHKNRQSHTTTG